jgi:hypothetical protein
VRILIDLLIGTKADANPQHMLTINRVVFDDTSIWNAGASARVLTTSPVERRCCLPVASRKAATPRTEESEHSPTESPEACLERLVIGLEN